MGIPVKGKKGVLGIVFRLIQSCGGNQSLLSPRFEAHFQEDSELGDFVSSNSSITSNDPKASIIGYSTQWTPVNFSVSS